MGLSNFLNDARNSAAQATNEKIDRIIADNLTRIQQLFSTRVGRMAKEIARDDSKMSEISRFVYGELPLPIRLLLKEDDFIDFCLKNRDKVLAESV